MTKPIRLIRNCCANIANFRCLLAPDRASPSGSITLGLLESFASLSVWLPALLTFYALARWVRMPAPAHIVVGSAMLYAAFARKPPSKSPVLKSTRGANFEFLNLGLLLALIAVLILPIFVSVVDACSGSPRFHSPDDAATLSMAQGQRLSFPPPDLRWAGATKNSHQGEALFVEGLARLTGASPSVAFYGIAPALIRIAFVGACWRFFSILFPAWSLRRRLAAIAVACGVFFVDPFAIVWNLRNFAVTREFNLETVFLGVPIAGVIPVSVANDLPWIDSSMTADVFLFGAISNIGTSGPIPVGAALFASYFAKSQTGLPALCGLLFTAALLCLVTKRAGLTLALPIVVALILFAFFRSVGPEIDDLIVRIGVGHNLKVALSAGYPFAQALGLESGRAAIVIGLLLWASKWCVPIALAVAALYAARVNVDDRGAVVVVALASAAAATVAFATIIVIRPGTELFQKFIETHNDVAHLLWNQRVPFVSYLEHMFTDISAAVANSFGALALAMFAGAGLVEINLRARSGFWKSITWVGIYAAWLAFLASIFMRVGPDHSRLMAGSKAVDSAAIESLARIPVQNSIIMTNELAYDRNKASYLPYMNSWAPALYGHQFWVADFMWSLSYPDIRPRFRAWKRFWNTDTDAWHEQLLAQEGIGWILEKKNESVLDPRTIRGVELVFENETYRVFRFQRKQGDGNIGPAPY